MRVHHGIIIENQPVPKEKIKQWHEILVTTGGHYLSNPREVGNNIIVHYAPGDYQLQCQMWLQCTTPIKEVRKDQKWRTFLRKMIFFYK